MLLVKRDAPVDLLLSTDVLPQLGFAMVQKNEDEVEDLLSHQPESSHKLDRATPNPQTTSQTTLAAASALTNPTSTGGCAMVRLIRAAKLPGRHSKLVRAEVEGLETIASTLLFQPELDILSARGLGMADAVVEQGQEVTVLITNFGAEPVHLEGGEVIGKAEPATLMEPNPDEAMNKGCEEDVCGGAEHGVIPEVAAIKPTSNETQEQLLTALSLESPDDDQSNQLRSLVLEFADRFALDSSELGHRSVVTHKIDTGGYLPIKQPLRRVPFSLRGKVQELTEEMLEQGVIQPSSSPWASPIVLMAKKDGSTRFCVYYRKLNAVTKLDVLPLPRIDDSLDLLAETRFFSTLDLASGYWQVGMDAESREKTAFTPQAGLFKFNVMPFGLCNAPATFQRLMENVLAGLAREKCIVYLDDILVMGKTFEEHLSNLKAVFSRLPASSSSQVSANSYTERWTSSDM